MSSFNAINLHSITKASVTFNDEYLEDITVFNDHAYIADHNTATIRIINISSNLSNFTLEGTYQYKSEDFYSLQVVGNYAYIAGGESGIEVFNISDIKNPAFVKQVKILAFSLDTYKNYLYVKNSMRSCSPVISVLEIKKDGKLSLINQVPIPECTDFKIKDGIIFYVSEED